MRIKTKTEKELQAMRKAGRVVALVLQAVGKLVRPGITTETIQREVDAVLTAEHAKPVFKEEAGFPKSACISVNEEVVHGIAGERVLKEGDIVSVDVGARVDGMIGDGAWTFAVGEVATKTRKLMEVGRKSLKAAIGRVRPGVSVREISGTIQTIAESAGFSVVRAVVGHGVGRKLHEPPQVPNYVTPPHPDLGRILHPGTTIAIEPMLAAGSGDVEKLANRWTYVTRDRSMSVHFEHTVAVVADGHEIMTTL